MEPPIQPSSQQTPSKPSIFNIDELSPRLKAFYNVKENVDYETLLNTSVNQAVGYRNPTEIVPNSAHINWPIPILPAVAAENEKCDALTATVEDVYEASSMDITDEGYSVNVRQLIQSSKSLAADDMEITGEESTMEELPITGSTGELNRTFAIEDALDGNRRYQSSPKRSVGISFMGASANCTQQLLNLLQPTSAETDGDVEEEAHEQKNLRDISTVSNNSATGDLLNILRGTAGVKELTATTVPTVLPNVEISIIPTVLDEITNKSSMSLATTETGPTLNLPSPESNVLPSKSIEVGVTDITDIDMAPDFSINNVSFETAPTEKLNLSSHQTSETVEMVPVSHPEPNESARATIFTASQIPLIRKIMETERLPVYPELSAEFSLKQWTVNSAKVSVNLTKL